MEESMPENIEGMFLEKYLRATTRSLGNIPKQLLDLAGVVETRVQKIHPKRNISSGKATPHPKRP